MTHEIDIAELPRLSHDARLVGGEHTGSTFTLVLECLRRGIDGSELTDRTVRLELIDVSAAAILFDTFGARTRPSEVVPPFAAASLVPWPFPAAGVEVSVNTPQDAEDLRFAAVKLWITGDLAAAVRAPIRLYVNIPRWPPVTAALWISCASVRASIDTATWAAEYDAWWKGWETYWNERDDDSDDDDEDAVAIEASMIPMRPDEPVDQSYQPPDEPAFELEDATVPDEIVAGLREHFESAFAKHEDGQWWYVRQVDEWWREGDRACVVVRGVEHIMPLDGDPARTLETVFEVALRRPAEHWVVRTWSQGWPAHGSAPAKPNSDKPWLFRWKLLLTSPQP